MWLPRVGIPEWEQPGRQLSDAQNLRSHRQLDNIVSLGITLREPFAQIRNACLHCVQLDKTGHTPG